MERIGNFWNLVIFLVLFFKRILRFIGIVCILFEDLLFRTILIAIFYLISEENGW